MTVTLEVDTNSKRCPPRLEFPSRLFITFRTLEVFLGLANLIVKYKKINYSSSNTFNIPSALGFIPIGEI